MSADISRGSAAVQPDSIDISSGADSGDAGPGTEPSVLWAYYDGGTPGDTAYADDNFGFRVRLGDDPQHGPSGGYVSYHWDILLDIDGDNWKEFVVDLSGDYSGSKPDRLYVFSIILTHRPTVRPMTGLTSIMPPAVQLRGDRRPLTIPCCYSCHRGTGPFAGLAGLPGPHYGF
ncbi:MAG: hypothetical protein JXA46_19170 [Dehalococcoidales bacterium]|nr:hypothetical protein [Dehalococcoidales bacterium]